MKVSGLKRITNGNLKSFCLKNGLGSNLIGDANMLSAPAASQTKNIEALHDDVFGKTFAMYDQAEMLRFIEPFKIRFERNQIDAKALFAGKKCLDAGCGNGRGSLFMAMHGAKEVHSLDISQTNIESVTKNAQIFGFSSIIKPQLSSLEDINFAAESFDFVWCNGVLMHTHNPDKCLQELARVLKPSGKSWIYVYGAGGVYWYGVYKFRNLLKDHTEAQCVDAMKLAQFPISFLAEYMDDWKAPYLRTYTQADFSKRLAELGFSSTKQLPFGTDYDTSHRNNIYPADKIFLGDGDLRYLLTKSGNTAAESSPISDSVLGSHYDHPSEYTKIIDEKFSIIESLCENSLVLKILACAYLQRNLRDNIFSSHQEFNLVTFVKYYDEAIELLTRVK
jgi:ubiquinone/menaquinone biosynthesis C-methylase UbiE